MNGAMALAEAMASEPRWARGPSPGAPSYTLVLRRLVAHPSALVGLTGRREIIDLQVLAALLDDGSHDLLSRSWVWSVRTRIAHGLITLQMTAMLSLLDAMMMAMLGDPASARLHLVRAMWLASGLP
jgi:hypothetical protein